MKVAVLALAAAVCLTGEATVVMEKVEDGASFDAPATEAFTASAWFKIETRRNEKGRHRYPRLFQFPGGYLQMSNPIHYDTMPSGDAILSIDVPGGADPKGESRWLFPESIPFRQWVHLTLVVRADPSFAPELYVNGVRVPTRFGPRPVPIAFPAGRFALGNRRKGGVGYPFDGSMAGFRYEPRAIGSAAIAEMVGAAPDGNLPKPFEVRLRDELPVIDFSSDTSIQTVIASGLREELFRNGFLVSAIGRSVIRIAPPLIITKAQALSFVKALDSLLSTRMGGKPNPILNAFKNIGRKETPAMKALVEEKPAEEAKPAALPEHEDELE